MSDQTHEIDHVADEPPEPEQHPQVIDETDEGVQVYPDQTAALLDGDGAQA